MTTHGTCNEVDQGRRHLGSSRRPCTTVHAPRPRRPVGMVPPFEVAATRSELYSGLLVLSKAPAAREVYKQLDLRRIVFSFFQGQMFHDLADAVNAALRADGLVQVLRDATLPGPPINLRGTCTSSGTWCLIPPGASVTIAAKGGARRLRHIGNAPSSLFAICDGAALAVRGLRFEALPFAGFNAGPPHFATVLPDHSRAGRLDIADDVTLIGYDDVLHLATGCQLGTFQQFSLSDARDHRVGRPSPQS